MSKYPLDENAVTLSLPFYCSLFLLSFLSSFFQLILNRIDRSIDRALKLKPDLICESELK